MEILKKCRERRGLSQRELARRARISFKGLQLIERRGHDPRLSTLRKLASALGLSGNGPGAVVDQFLAQDADSIRAASFRILDDGFDSWPVHLFTSVDTFRFSRDRLLIDAPPFEATDEKIRCLMASTVEVLCREADMTAPPWCRAVGCLVNPWFVAGVESLKAMALVESPGHFRKRNIFVLDNFLERA